MKTLLTESKKGFDVGVFEFVTPLHEKWVRRRFKTAHSHSKSNTKSANFIIKSNDKLSSKILSKKLFRELSKSRIFSLFRALVYCNMGCPVAGNRFDPALFIHINIILLLN